MLMPRKTKFRKQQRGRRRGYAKGQQQVQEVSGGSGFCAQNQRVLHFGLGERATVEKAVVRWPSGKIQVLTNPQPNRVHKVEEPA